MNKIEIGIPTHEVCIFPLFLNTLVYIFKLYRGKIAIQWVRPLWFSALQLDSDNNCTNPRAHTRQKQGSTRGMPSRNHPTILCPTLDICSTSDHLSVNGCLHVVQHCLHITNGRSPRANTHIPLCRYTCTLLRCPGMQFTPVQRSNSFVACYTCHSNLSPPMETMTLFHAPEATYTSDFVGISVWYSHGISADHPFLLTL